MVERQPTGCLCFFRKNQKSWEDDPGQGAAHAAKRLQHGLDGDWQIVKTSVGAGGAQPGHRSASRSEPELASDGDVPRAVALPPSSLCTTSPCTSILPPSASVGACSMVLLPTTRPPAAPTDSTCDVQPSTDTATTAALVVAVAADAAEEVRQDTRTLFTTSHVSTLYFSAGGWSQFGDDVEWLGGGPPSVLLAPSTDWLSDPAALTSPNAGAGAGAGAHDPDVGGAEEPSEQQHACPHEHQQLQDLPQQQQTSNDRADSQQPQNQQRHDYSHGDGGKPPREPLAGNSLPVTDGALKEHHLMSKLSPVEVLPAAPLPPRGQMPKPVIQTAQKAADTDTPAGIHQDDDTSLAVNSSLCRREEQHSENQPSLLPELQQQQQQTAPVVACECSDAKAARTNNTPIRYFRPNGSTPSATGGEAAADQANRAAMLDQVANLYAAQGRPCMACQVLLQYCKANNVAPESLRPELHVREMPDAGILAKVAQGVSDCLSDIANDEGWQLVRNDDLQLLYQHLPGQGVHAFRARCVVEAPIEHLVSIAREVDLCPTWNKYCTSAAVLQEKSATDVVAYLAVWMPWPFHDVAFMVEANGADLYDEEGRLVICFSSPDRNATGPEAPPAPPPGSEKHRNIRLLAPSCMTFEPLPPKAPGGPPRTRCVVQTYVDPRVRHVPPFIITFVLKVLGPFVYSAVLKVLSSAFKSPDDPLPKRIKQRSELYSLLRRRTEAYLKSKAAAVAVPSPGKAAGEISGSASSPAAVSGRRR